MPENEKQYTMYHTPIDNGTATAHYYSAWQDVTANAMKVWFFQQDGAQASVGLPTFFEERQAGVRRRLHRPRGDHADRKVRHADDPDRPGGAAQR